MQDFDKTTMTDSVAGVILAAGRGSRMGEGTPKVLRLVAGRPMVTWVVDALKQGGVKHVCVVVSPIGSDVREAIGDEVVYAIQQEPKGSGDAAAAAALMLDNNWDNIVVACGDSPLFRHTTVERMIDTHLRTGAVVTLASAELDNPKGYGRIIRSPGGRIDRIVEQNQAGPEELDVKEINGGLYVFKALWMWRRLSEHLWGEGEFVLTEIVAEAAAEGLTIASSPCDADEVAGVNTPMQLEEASVILRRRLEGSVVH